MDAEVKMLENEIKQACLVDKPRMARQGVDDHTNELEDYFQKLISLLPWLRSHITQCSNQGNSLHTVEHAMLTITRAIKDFLWTILEGEMEPCTSGVTT